MATVAVLSELPGITEVDWSDFCIKQRLVLVLSQPQDLWGQVYCADHPDVACEPHVGQLWFSADESQPESLTDAALLVAAARHRFGGRLAAVPGMREAITKVDQMAATIDSLLQSNSEGTE